jgi:hypothetical protein
VNQETDYLIPINFSLTERAIEKIRAFNQQCRIERDIDPIPAMCWLLNGTDEDGQWKTYDVPEIGIYDRGVIPESAIQNVDGLELVFSVSPDVVPKFENQLIDYEEAKGFHFVDRR